MDVSSLNLTEFFNIVANNGFAIAVAWYCLTRLEKSLKENTEAMKQMMALVGGKLGGK